MPEYVALINLRSGGRRAAAYVLRKLRQKLGDDLVWVLFEHGEAEKDRTALEAFLQRTAPHYIIVAGGDGTISFAMDEVKQLQTRGDLAGDRGVIAPFPLGTGNDLSITLGFGSGFARWIVLGHSRFQRLLRTYEAATVTSVDRWSLRVVTAPGQGGQQVEHNYVLNNYFSVGFDAAVANRLNQFRGRHPHLFVTRPVVKLWYAVFAAIALFTEQKIGATVLLRIDGRAVAVPASAKAVAVCNMLTYAGGSVAWNKYAGDQFTKPSVSDRKVEVVCFYGIWHLALVRLGWCYGQKLGQGGVVTIETACHSCQFDGEAVTDVVDAAGTSSIHVEHFSTSQCLTSPPRPETNALLILLGVVLLLLAILLIHYW